MHQAVAEVQPARALRRRLCCECGKGRREDSCECAIFVIHPEEPVPFCTHVWHQDRWRRLYQSPVEPYPTPPLPSVAVV